MPIYEYECAQCGCVEEVIQKFSDKPLNTCKRCSGKLTKLMSQSTFHLKGSGWYVTDYANKSDKSSSVKEPNKEHKKDSQKDNSSGVKTKSGSGESKIKSKTSKEVAS